MLTVLDLFCGAGGLSKGFELAGFKILGGIDFNPDAIKTHEFNFPESISICEDMSKISDERITNIFSDQIDVIIGGPPCQGFSIANKWQRESDDPRNKLFFEFIRFVEVLKPKAILIENVKGILSKDGGYAKQKIETIIGELGYHISSSVLNAQDFGVPQSRQRAVFVGIRNDIGFFDFSNLSKCHELSTVKEAIGELYDLEYTSSTTYHLNDKPITNLQKFLRASDNIIHNHDIRYPKEIVIQRMMCVPQGGNWKQVDTELWPNTRQNRHSSAYKRLAENHPSITIDTGHMNYFHPIYNRVPTVRESARLQSFPDNFIFLGSITSQFRQVGNAVPPLLSRAIAKKIKEVLSNENN